MPATAWGWTGPILVTAIAGVLRFHRLGIPRAFVFDETYYAKDAWSLLQYGHERNWRPADEADALVVDGVLQDVWGEGPAYVVHPPFGKWMIAAGEWAFGLTPFGWRFIVALLGTLSVLMVARIARRMFRSTLLGCIAGLLLALEGLHYVVSRTALLDGILMFWVLAAFGCLIVDRDRARSLLAAGRMNLGLRPWRIAAGLCLGAACATKWSGLYYVAAFGLLTVLWDVGARRSAGAQHPWNAMLRRDAIPAFVSIVVVTRRHVPRVVDRLVRDQRRLGSAVGSRQGVRLGVRARRRCAAFGTTTPRCSISTPVSTPSIRTTRMPGAGCS